MKHSIFFLKIVLPFFLLSLNSIAQIRYKEEITDSVRVETFTYALKDGKPLDLDVYFPAPDNQTKRPLIFYVHGAVFQADHATNLKFRRFAKNWQNMAM